MKQQATDRGTSYDGYPVYRMSILPVPGARQRERADIASRGNVHSHKPPRQLEGYL